MSKLPDRDIEARAKKEARAKAKEQANLSTKAFLDQFISHTERGTALSVTAYLDVKVRTFWERAWISDDTDARDNMLRPEGGPMGSLGARIRLCYLSGWLKKRTFRDLDRIVKIRNLFAHRQEAETFSFPEIENLCGQLQINSDALEFFGGGEEGEASLKFYRDFKYDLQNPRWSFVAATGYLANRFQGMHHHPMNTRRNLIRPLF